jgi:hypothetical protein
MGSISRIRPFVPKLLRIAPCVRGLGRASQRMEKRSWGFSCFVWSLGLWVAKIGGSGIRGHTTTPF